MKNMYESESDQLMTTFRKEQITCDYVKSNRKKYFENILHATNLLTTNVIQNKASTFQIESEDYVSHSIQKREKIRDNIVAHMQRLYAQMQGAVNSIRATTMTEIRLKNYGNLVKRELSDTATFAKIRAETQECHIVIDKLEHELLTLECRIMHQMSAMKHEKVYFMDCFLKLRQEYEKDIKNDQKRFRFLVAKTNKAILVR